MSLNKIVLMGRLVYDPELKVSKNGKSYSRFCLACNRDRKDKNGNNTADFIDCSAFAGTAEYFCKYFSKGRMVVVEGRLQIDKWTDDNGEQRRSATVMVQEVYFGDSKRDGGGEPRKPMQETQKPRQSNPPEIEYDEEFEGEEFDIDGEDLPW